MQVVQLRMQVKSIEDTKSVEGGSIKRRKWLPGMLWEESSLR